MAEDNALYLDINYNQFNNVYTLTNFIGEELGRSLSAEELSNEAT